MSRVSTSQARSCVLLSAVTYSGIIDRNVLTSDIPKAYNADQGVRREGIRMKLPLRLASRPG
ncbi:hypothetical protein F4604DRAFT_1922353 [Suillus subluteus]|nr:hypothetical protein F4604DRAFT_1922328 [Suillus subluteus]KAG1881325.1 hypothetical protein F4604DRAFT_1922353 [Suillus subluteus]